MNYQTFSGQDLKEALGAVRAAFGPDALIGPTRHVQIAGSHGLPELRVEVQAAPSGQGTQARSPWPFSSALGPEPKRPAPRAPVVPPRALLKPKGATPDPGRPQGSLSLSKMEQQLAELRAMVEAVQAQLPSKHRAITLLSEMGIEGAVAQRFGSRMGKAKNDDEILEKLEARLVRGLPEGRDPLRSGRPELVACIGPTGVGKTTTLAKMAAIGKLEHGRSVAIVSLDHYRVGAADQWQRYGKLMGVPVFSPRGPRELEEVLTSNTADLLLVDTPSVGSTEDASMRAFSELSHKARRHTHVLLLLPAWLRGNDAEKLLARYDSMSPTALGITKLDESPTVGGIVQAAIAGALPITHLSRGPRVPEHLEFVSATALVRQLVDGTRQH